MAFTFALKFDHKRCHIHRYNGRDVTWTVHHSWVNCKFDLSELHSGLIYRTPGVLGRLKYLPLIELLGKTFDDPFVQDYMKRCPFDIISDNNQPRFVAKEADKTWTFSIEEVMVVIMRRALFEMFSSAAWDLNISSEGARVQISREDLETKLKEFMIKISVIVVVPNSFGEAQRRAMMAAAGLAGMNVTNVVSQATSVASFFNTVNRDRPSLTGPILDNSQAPEMIKESRLSQGGNFLFFHFGKSSLDISVIRHTKEEGVVEIKLATGESTFGGKDFIHRLMEGVPKEFIEEGSKELQAACHLLNHYRVALVPPTRRGKNFYWLIRGVHEIRASELANHQKYPNVYPIEPDEPWKLTPEQREEAHNLEKAELEKASYRLTRQTYEQKCADLLERVKQLLTEAISEAGIAPSDYQSVQMYGKYCRLPGVLDIVREQLPHTLISFGDGTSPDYVVENNVEYLGKNLEYDQLRLERFFSFKLYEHDYDLMGAACLSFVLNRGRPLYREMIGLTVKHDIPHKNLRLINKSQVGQLGPNL